MCLSERSGFFARRQRSIVRCEVAWLLLRGCMLLSYFKKASSKQPCLDNPLLKVNLSKVHPCAHRDICDAYGSLISVAAKIPSCCSVSILARVMSVIRHVLQECSILYITSKKTEVLTAHKASHVLSCHLAHAAPTQHHLLCSFTTAPARLLEYAVLHTNMQHDTRTGNGFTQRLKPLLRHAEAMASCRG